MKARQLKPSELKDIRLVLLKRQKYLCKICGCVLDIENNSKNVHLDHCHKTGFIRAVLCRRCNTLEGELTNWYIRLTKRELKSNEDKIALYRGLTRYLKAKPTKWIHPGYGKKKRRKKRKKK